MPRLTKRKIQKWSILLLLTAALFFAVKTGWENRSPDSEFTAAFYAAVRSGADRQMSVSLMPLLSFLDDRSAAAGLPAYLETSLLKQMPLYYHSEQLSLSSPEVEDELTLEMLIRQEARDEDVKNIPESELDYNDSAIHIEESMMNAFLDENSPENTSTDPDGNPSEDIPAALQAFQIPASPAYSYDWSQGFTFDELIANFYAVDSTTSVTEQNINLENLLNRDLSIDKTAVGPQILIYHTHSQETFADSIPGDKSTTIVGAGERLASLLTNRYGFRVLHHTEEFDAESRDYAYSNALPVIEELLAGNPTIQVVIDLHRDEMPEERKLVMDIQGRPTARFMFFNGLSFSNDTGEIAYLKNPYIDTNLALSFQQQVAANEYYPGLARKIYLRAYRYNMHVAPKTTLIELGAQNNTVEEIMNACEPLAHVIATVLDNSLV